MSFLSTNYNEYLTARITKKGRNAISKGDFVISYFQVGDSEFDYTSPFHAMSGTGSTPNQKVFSPMDHQVDIKYPYKLDSTSGTTTYGNPIQNASTDTIRNVMGPAGFVSNYKEYSGNTGTTIMCVTSEVPFSGITGDNSIVVTSGNTYQNCEYVSLVFGLFDNTDPDYPVLSGTNYNSLVFRIISISGNTLYFDRNTPNLSIVTGMTGTAEVVGNKCEIEFPSSNEVLDGCTPTPIDPIQQHDPWTLNVVWGDNPIGYTGVTNNNLSGFTSNKFVSTKQFLGYTTSSGQTINTGTTYVNSWGEEIIVTPEEQRVLAIIHYSELGDFIYDPERFFKYDDYISTNDDLGDSIVDDDDENPMTDTEYFEVYIPFILYNRNTGTTVGAKFHMDTTDYEVTTPTGITDSSFALKYRYLLDEQGYRVGRVYYENKTIVFDDQDLVAVLDYRSSRKYTLGAPKVFLTHSDDTIGNSLISGTTNQRFWITYTFQNIHDESQDILPSNYYVKLDVLPEGGDCNSVVPSNIGVKFNVGTFQYMNTIMSGITTGFLATHFKILVQETAVDEYPSPDMWREIDFSVDAGSISGTTYLDPNNIENVTFVITKIPYDDASFYTLNAYMGDDYVEGTYKFGDEQPFPGSVRLVRATDIEVMNFLVNLPSTQFLETQNPTYSTGKSKKITEISLLDSNKEVFAIAKTSKPITRVGTQVFAVKLDF
jgi:hypothetical protein